MGLVFCLLTIDEYRGAQLGFVELSWFRWIRVSGMFLG